MATDDTPSKPDAASSRQDPVLLRSFSSAPEAEAVAAALKVAGFQCWLSSDDCGGMYAAMDVVQGVHLFVRSADYAAADSFLKATPSAIDPGVFSPSETAATAPITSQSMTKGRLMPFVAGLVVGVLLCLLYQWADKLGTKNYRRDWNSDGKPDETWVYLNGHASESLVDRNFDGVLDSWSYYDSEGKQTLVRADENFDTVPDATWYYTNGLLVSSSLDTDFNGVPDVTYFFKHDLPQRTDWQPNGTNIISLRQFFRHGVLVEEQRDTDFDGAFDVVVLYDPFQNPIRTNAFKLLSPSSP